jgi:phospholipase C
VLKMIEWRWGLKPLTVRDVAARNLAEVLDFQSTPNLSAPRWNVPHVTPDPCLPVHFSRTQEWAPLKQRATAAGVLR